MLRLSPGVLGLLAAVGVAGAAGRTEAAALVLVVLGSLLLHEVAHALAARASGYDVDHVRLTLFGGEARWSGPEPAPHVAIRITAAGPFASGVLACAFAVGGDGPVAQFGAWVNLLGAGVNLLPVPGLDGWALYRDVMRDRSAASLSANQGWSTDQT
jgi:Zn-dependent protease